MVKTTFISHDGQTFEVEGSEGDSLMQVAVENGVPGIDADCGGACACATCHVYVSDEWNDKLESPNALEAGMLDFVTEPRPNSRLSCQITLDESLHGLVVSVPESQH